MSARTLTAASEDSAIVWARSAGRLMVGMSRALDGGWWTKRHPKPLRAGIVDMRVGEAWGVGLVAGVWMLVLFWRRRP